MLLLNIKTGLLLTLQYFASVLSTVNLDIPTPVVSVNETEAQRQNLTPDPNQIKCSDTDGDLTRVYIQRMTPSNPCSACFRIWPCGPSDEDFCLMFLPSQGTFAFGHVSSYTILVECTDDKDSPVSSSIEVRLIGNTPPRFDPADPYEMITFDFTRNRRAGAVIHTVGAQDDEGDAVFFIMSVFPTKYSRYFSIGYTSGTIQSTVDMRMLCEDTVSFYVSLMDPYHNPVGPKVIQVTFLKINDPPVITDVKTRFYVDEDKGVDYEILKINVTDKTVYVNDNTQDNVTFSVVTDPAGGLDIYKLTGKRVLVRRKLDYEFEELRTVEMTVQAFDGFCYSDTYAFEITIEDVNEPFVLQPDFFQPVFLEGLVTYYPPMKIVDPDLHDTYTYTKIGGNGKMKVESTTGRVNSIEILDIGSKEEKNFPIEIRVEDSGGHTAVFEVNTTIQDLNDKAPYFFKRIYEIKVDNCTQLGEVIDKVNGRDDDSKLRGNGETYKTGSGAHFTVASDGSVIYTSLMQVGDVDTASVYVHDMGEIPGPLTGLPTVVTVTCEICTPPAPTGPTTTTAAPTTTAPFNFVFPAGYPVDENARTFFSENVAWISGAAVAGAGLIALVAYMAWRLKQPRPLSRHLPRKTDKHPPKGNGSQSNGQGPQTTQQAKTMQNSQITPRSVIPEIAAKEQIMHVPPLPFPQYFQEANSSPGKPHKPKTNRKEHERRNKEKRRHKDKHRKEKPSKPEEKPSDSPEPAETSRKPKMDIPGEYVELDIVTPRGNVLID